MADLYLAHSAKDPDDTDWWIVEPRDDPPRLVVEIHSLIWVGRTVLAVDLTGKLPVRRLTLDSVPWPDA